MLDRVRATMSSFCLTMDLAILQWTIRSIRYCHSPGKFHPTTEIRWGDSISSDVFTASRGYVGIIAHAHPVFDYGIFEENESFLLLICGPTRLCFVHNFPSHHVPCPNLRIHKMPLFQFRPWWPRSTMALLLRALQTT